MDSSTNHPNVYFPQADDSALQIREKIANIEETIQHFQKLATMDMDEIASNVTMKQLTDKERTLKIEYAKKMHVTEDGKPRRITPNGKLYRTYLADRTPVRASSEESVYLKLYDYYSDEINTITDYSIGHIFTLALNEKTKSKGIINTTVKSKDDNASKKNTLTRDKQDYTRFISEEFAELDIRNIKKQMVKDYIIDRLICIFTTTGKKLSQKSFNDHFKHILNLIFDFAAEHEIIDYNFIRNSTYFKSELFSDLLDYTKKDAEEKAFSQEEILTMVAEVKKRMHMPDKYSYIYTNGYMFILSTKTGMRVGELCSLKKSDIDFVKKRIHVHSQQLLLKNSNEFVYCTHTKNEKKGSLGGRYVPLTDDAIESLKELFAKQEKLGIKSEWVFANPDGSWIRSDQYINFLYRLSKSFGYGITNNHAIRMYFNSYVLIPAGVEAPERAKILGHSIEVNLRHYAFANRNYCEQTRLLINT